MLAVWECEAKLREIKKEKQRVTSWEYWEEYIKHISRIEAAYMGEYAKALKREEEKEIPKPTPFRVAHIPHSKAVSNTWEFFRGL